MKTKKRWVNFAEVRANVHLEDVLIQYYGITELRRSGERKLIGPCPVHGGDSPRAFHADLERNIWHCFSRCGGGNQLDLVALKEGISIREAALQLQAFFLSGDDRPVRVKAPSTRPNTAKTTVPDNLPVETHSPPEPNPVLSINLALQADHPHLMDDRGLLPETTMLFGVGYCSRGIMRGTIAIPIHNSEGELVAYAGRRLKGSDIAQYGKYKLPKGFRRELEVYNFHRAMAVLAEPQTERPDPCGLILVEGFFSVLKLYEAGFPNAVASMGCEVSSFQASLLAQASEVLILFDGNDAGRVGATKARELLAGQTTVRLAHLPDGLEPESLEPRALRWLIRGMQGLNLSEVRLVL